MAERTWTVRYPEGLVPYLELFRVDYIPYDTYDRVLCDYLREHVGREPLRVCSLGCGTGQHENNLVRAGHHVVGVDCHAESLDQARRNAADAGVELTLILGDITDEKSLAGALRDQAPFDAAIMLGVQLSMDDHARSALNISKYLRPGGAFVAGLWGYQDGFDPNLQTQESCVEIAGSATGGPFAVRLNTYSYYRDAERFMIDWDSVYLFPGPSGEARLHRRETDRMEIAPERSGIDPLGLQGVQFELLPARRLVECGDTMCLPHTYEYLIGWRIS